MFDANALYKQRFSAHLKETSRYLRYIFNGHLAFAMLFFVSASAVYYQKWLENLPANFPTALLISVIFGLLASYSPVRTLLREADLVFLIASEHKMHPYFRNGLIYSFVIQLYAVLLAAAALGPLYFASFPNEKKSVYLLAVLILLIFKVWNLIANWWILKTREANIRLLDQLVRMILTIAVLYFFIKGSMLLAGIMTVLFVAIFLYNLARSRKQAGLYWELLVSNDRQRMQTFYRIANMFTDVPHIKSPVKKRRLLISLFGKTPYGKKYTYDYLYRITFIRSGDYFGMYIRLILIGGIAIYYVPNFIMQLLFGVLFMYMSVFQMMTLYQHHRTIMWTDLYPVGQAGRKGALLKLLYQLAFVQTILFGVVFLLKGDLIGCISIIGIGLVFNTLFIRGYVTGKLK